MRGEAPKPSWVDAIDEDDTHAAAGLYLRAKAASTDRNRGFGERQQATRTVHAVNERFPEAREVAATAAHHELGIEGEDDVVKARDLHRAEMGHTAGSAAKARRAGGGRGGGPKAPAARGTRTGSGRRRGRKLGSYVPDLELAPGGVTSWGRLLFQTFGWGVGLSMAYLILTNTETAPRGRSAVELAARGVTNTLAALVSPIADPLSPGRAVAAARARAQTAPARAPALPSRTAQRQSAHAGRVGPYATR